VDAVGRAGAENAAKFLGKGSHVNVVERVRNHTYEKDGETIYGLAFTPRGDRLPRRQCGVIKSCAPAEQNSLGRADDTALLATTDLRIFLQVQPTKPHL